MIKPNLYIMTNQDFKLNFKFVWILITASTVFTVIGSFGKPHLWENPSYFLIAGVSLSIITWMIVLTDMISQNIFNKAFWVGTMFICSPLSMILYMFQRNKLIKYGQMVKANEIVRS